jgi:hypothetical protein
VQMVRTAEQMFLETFDEREKERIGSAEKVG